MSGIPKECKRLAEVDFPIAEVSRHAAREKSIRHGHPATLHLWWARRPLASSRAILLELLLPDPCDPHCPSWFKEKARDALPRSLTSVGPTDADLRAALVRFVGAFANWDRSADSTYLNAARNLVKLTTNGGPPLVVDPFGGGGSIPLEGLRLGCDVFASDLNPLSCLIQKILLESIPRASIDVAEELTRAGRDLKQEVEGSIRDLYPVDADGTEPIAYLWARTVRCESPNCGAEIPLCRSFWLSKKPGRLRALRAHVDSVNSGPPSVRFEIFSPSQGSEPASGTVTRAKATCLACGAILPPERVRAQLRDQRGGADPILDEDSKRVGGATLLAVVGLKSGKPGRQYRLPQPRDYRAILTAKKSIEHLSTEGLPKGVSPIPDEPTPTGGGSGAGRAFSTHIYGITQWGDLYTSRQKAAIAAFIRRVRDYAGPEIVQELLALTLDHTIERCTSFCRWSPDAYMETIQGVYGRQALSMVWDFAEGVPLSESTGSFLHGLDVKAEAVRQIQSVFRNTGQVQQADACEVPLPDGTAAVWFTDPPYYDAIPYSDLSDLFFVWLRRELPHSPLLTDRFDHSNNLTPKDREIVQDETRSFEGRPKDGKFFESRIGVAFAEGRRVLSEGGIGCVVFAHKTTEGWEALLSGLVKGGWTISGSWPVATERPNRLRSQESAALATSVHLICRPRPTTAPTGEWAEVARELPVRVRDWMDRLEREGIRGADLIFACIGPAMEVYSRYSRVLDAEDREIPLGGDPTESEPHKQGFLAKVWEVVGRVALEHVLGGQKGGTPALEEDARLTALFLWAIQTSVTSGSDDLEPSDETSGSDETESLDSKTRPGFSLVYDVVRRFAQPLGIHLDIWEGRIIETDKGIVRLLPVAERSKLLFSPEEIEELRKTGEYGGAVGGRQMTLYPDQEPPLPEIRPTKTRGQRKVASRVDETRAGPRRMTTLDRLHIAMLLQASGASGPLRTLLQEERSRGPEFDRLARSLNALYPKDSEERRLIEALALVILK